MNRCRLFGFTVAPPRSLCVNPRVRYITKDKQFAARAAISNTVILAMPYGSLDSDTLSMASQKGLERAVTEWQGTRQISKPSTFLVVTSYKYQSDQELALRKALLARLLGDDEFSNNIIFIEARNEEDLATKVVRTKALIPIQTLLLFAESRHAVSVSPIFV